MPYLTLLLYVICFFVAIPAAKAQDNLCTYEYQSDDQPALRLDFSKEPVVVFGLGQDIEQEKPFDVILRFSSTDHHVKSLRQVFKNVMVKRGKLVLPASFLQQSRFAFERYPVWTLTGLDKPITLDFGSQWPLILTQLKRCQSPSHELFDSFFETNDQNTEWFADWSRTFLSLADIQIGYLERDPVRFGQRFNWGNDHNQGLLMFYPVETNSTQKEFLPWVENAVFSQRQFCSGAFVYDLTPVEEIREYKVIRADMACSERGDQTVASFLFAEFPVEEGKKQGRFLFFAEGNAETSKERITARDNLFSALMR